MKNVVHAACSHDCPDACGVLITVDDSGRATKIQGDPSHPVTRGFLCAKVAKYLHRVYSPDRVLYPMRRVKPKGKGPGGASDFTRITWDEAYEEIAHRFTAISQQFGPEAILPYSYAGNLGALGYASMDRRFFYRLGASQLDRTICSTAGKVGYDYTIGAMIGTDPEEFANARLIVLWGTNTVSTNVHMVPFIKEAKAKGARVVLID